MPKSENSAGLLPPPAKIIIRRAVTDHAFPAEKEMVYSTQKEGELAKFECECGFARFNVFSLLGHYETRVKCLECGNVAVVHSG